MRSVVRYTKSLVDSGRPPSSLSRLGARGCPITLQYADSTSKQIIRVPTPSPMAIRETRNTVGDTSYRTVDSLLYTRQCYATTRDQTELRPRVQLDRAAHPCTETRRTSAELRGHLRARVETAHGYREVVKHEHGHMDTRACADGLSPTRHWEETSTSP